MTQFMMKRIELRDETSVMVETVNDAKDPELRVSIEIEYGDGYFLKLKLTTNERAELMQALQASIDE